ncbi:MAG TPA: type II CAAX endopeptidase family protein [Candidatus Sulfomarinibacteraceae bacterium]|nr:type II CAAX endopeptidase family protein [Candidatus Sulfomarinibacteraceae bacterium]
MSDMVHNAVPATILSRRPLLAFFALTFLISPVLFLGPMLLVARGGPGWLEILGGILVAWAPNLAAIIVAGARGGRSAVRDLLAGFLVWRVKARWYLAAILGPVILVYTATAAYVLLTGQAGGLLAHFSLGAFLLLLLNHAIRGPLGEEAGWRGFALPRLQARYGALRASLILGVIWSVWHFPYWFLLVQDLFPGAPGRMALLFVSLAIVVVPLSVVMTWLYNRTRGSLLIAMLLHLSWNMANDLVNLPWDVQFAMLAGLYLLAATALIVAGRPAPHWPTHRRSTVYEGQG